MFGIPLFSVLTNGTYTRQTNPVLVNRSGYINSSDIHFALIIIRFIY